MGRQEHFHALLMRAMQMAWEMSITVIRTLQGHDRQVPFLRRVSSLRGAARCWVRSTEP